MKLSPWWYVYCFCCERFNESNRRLSISGMQIFLSSFHSLAQETETRSSSRQRIPSLRPQLWMLTFDFPCRFVLLLQGEGVLARAEQRHGGGGGLPTPHRQGLATVHRHAVGLAGRGGQEHREPGQRTPSPGSRRERLRGLLLYLGRRLAFRGPPLRVTLVAAAASLDPLADPLPSNAMMPKKKDQIRLWLLFIAQSWEQLLDIWGHLNEEALRSLELHIFAPQHKIFFYCIQEKTRAFLDVLRLSFNIQMSFEVLLRNSSF